MKAGSIFYLLWLPGEGDAALAFLKLGVDHHFSEVTDVDLKVGDSVITGEGRPMSALSIMEQHL